jgi:hypothetical protein
MYSICKAPEVLMNKNLNYPNYKLMYAVSQEPSSSFQGKLF